MIRSGQTILELLAKWEDWHRRRVELLDSEIARIRRVHGECNALEIMQQERKFHQEQVADAQLAAQQIRGRQKS